MRKIFNTIQNKANEMVIKAKTALDNVKGEGYVESGVKILIAVVIGALLLAGLYTLFNSTIMPTVTKKITDPLRSDSDSSCWCQCPLSISWPHRASM